MSNTITAQGLQKVSIVLKAVESLSPQEMDYFLKLFQPAEDGTKISKWAYWVRISGPHRTMDGLVKVAFQVKSETDLRRLRLAVTGSWNCTDSYGANLISWTPMPFENEQVTDSE